MAGLGYKGEDSVPIGEGLAHYAILSLLGPAWFCCGKLAQRAKLPQITGYVIGGIICGPSGKLFGVAMRALRRHTPC